MENNQTTQADLILLNENEGNPKIPLVIGIASILLLLLAVLFEFVVFFGLGFVSFLSAFILSIIGVVTASKFRKKYSTLTLEQNRKLQLGKWLSLITLILSSLIIVGAISLIILIGNQGFGR